MLDNQDRAPSQEGQGALSGIIPLGATGSLTIFEDMRREVVEASTTSQVKAVLDRVVILKAAARAAHNREIEADAQVLTLEAERKLGQLMKAQADLVGLNVGTAGRGRPNLGGVSDTPPKTDDRPTLAEAGIDKNLAKRAREAASMSDFEFEETKKTKRKVALIPIRRRPSPSRRKPVRRSTRKSPDVPAIDPDEQGALRKLQMENLDLHKRVAELSREAMRAAITVLIQSGIDAGSLFNLTCAQPPFGPHAFHELVLRMIKIDKLWLKQVRQAAASRAEVVQ